MKARKRRAERFNLIEVVEKSKDKLFDIAGRVLSETTINSEYTQLQTAHVDTATKIT